MSWDQDIGMPIAERRDDGEWVQSGEARRYRAIGELLLRVDEMEDTLRLMESQSAYHADAEMGSRGEAVRRLEERLRAERARLNEMERRGGIQYDQVERAIRLADAMG